MGERIPGGQDFPEPPRLRQLRRLVTALTATLILGVITIVVLLVIRLGPLAAPVSLPRELALPPGESARAVTLGEGWIAVVTVEAFKRAGPNPSREKFIAAMETLKDFDTGVLADKVTITKDNHVGVHNMFAVGLDEGGKQTVFTAWGKPLR